MTESIENETKRLDVSGTPDNSHAIEVKDLKKHYIGKKQMEDVLAVDGVSFQVKTGELFGLLGPNGAGKTTIIQMLTGILSPTEGTAVIGGYDVNKELNMIKELIGVCPQEPAVYKFLSGLGNI